MRLELTGRHLDITPALRRLVDAKLARLDRLLKDAAVSAQIVLTREKHNHRADITLHARGEKFLHGVGTGGAWEPCLTAAIGKLAQQAQRVKGKWQERRRRGGAKSGVEAAAAPSIAPAARLPRARMPRTLRAFRQAVKAMTVADAARAMDGRGEEVLVFRDAETQTISVIYRRPGGELQLVETDV